ncbi:hypothetical protein HDU85_006720 [Gaertneriomyces sp. JEL0708]|nr:hypothetical protein HDU85_006720 [Gaertneriomyces sp. JEL0708]
MEDEDELDWSPAEWPEDDWTSVSLDERGKASHDAEQQSSPVQSTTLAPSALLPSLLPKAGTLASPHVLKTVQKSLGSSKFMAAKTAQAETVSRRIEKLKPLAEHIRLTGAGRVPVEGFMKKVTSEIKEMLEREGHTWWVCVDMDAFFASVEERDRPELKTRPMAVGGMSMLSTANYEGTKQGEPVAPSVGGVKWYSVITCRKYGVRSAMPGYIAKKLCPELVLVSSDMQKYIAVSNEVREVFVEYDPTFRMMSLDEAFLNLTPYLAQHPTETAETALASLRAKVYAKTRCTCSGGAGGNRTVAKIAASLRKPNGQTVLDPRYESTLEFLKPLLLKQIPGIGPVMSALLSALGIETVNDLRQVENLCVIYGCIGGKGWQFLGRIAAGAYSSGEHGGDRKSVGCERTFRDSSNEVFLLGMLEKLAQNLEHLLAEKTLKARHLTLKLKTSGFVVTTHGKTLDYSVSQAPQMYRIAKKLLEEEVAKRGAWPELRLMGLSAAKLFKHTTDDHCETSIAKLLKRKHSDRKAVASWQCPVCLIALSDADDLRSVNKHLDACLDADSSSGSNKDAARVDRKRRRTGIEAYFNKTSL